MKPSSESTATVIPLGPTHRVSTDARLARLAAGGDRAAFAVIFDRYHQELYRYCVSLLHDSDDAADALQNTMLHALRALEGDGRDIAVRPWLYRIAHNESVSLLRRRSKAESVAEAVSMAVLDVEGSAAMRARLQTVLDDIRTLPERQRAALVMRELSGLTYGEIAGALLTSPAGAKQAVYDARRTLLELARGRDETCESIQLRISAGDRRVARARAVRAHLRACADCRMFQAQIADRERALAGLAPVLPAAVAAHVLKGALVGTGGTTAEGVLFGVGTTVVGKAAATVAVTVALGAGAAGIDRAESNDGAVTARPGIAPSQQQPHAYVAAGRHAGGDAAAMRRVRGPATRAVEPAADRRPTRDGTVRRRSSQRSPVERGQASTSVPVAPVPARRSRRWTIRRPGGGAGGDGREPGPVRTGVRDIRDDIGETVDGVRDNLPIRTPALPSPVDRLPR